MHRFTPPTSLADGLVTDGRSFRALNDEDFLDWITRHGAPEEVAEFPFIHGLYDLVFAHLEDRTHHGVCAGTSVFLTTKMFFEYRGAIFWKTAAGMGDILFAPLYQALRQRGVEFEFFHRIDNLLTDPSEEFADVELNLRVKDFLRDVPEGSAGPGPLSRDARPRSSTG